MNFSCLLHTAETPIIIITATSSSHSLAAFQFTSSLVFLIFWESFLNWFHFHLLVQLCWLCSYFWWIFCYAAHFSYGIHQFMSEHFLFPFDFTQSNPCLLPALMEFVIFILCFILGQWQRCHPDYADTISLSPAVSSRLVTTNKSVREGCEGCRKLTSHGS